MAPLGTWLWNGTHARRVLEDDLRGRQGVSRPSGGDVAGPLLAEVQQASCHCVSTSVGEASGMPLLG
jgi:hypothetical protein